MVLHYWLQPNTNIYNTHFLPCVKCTKPGIVSYETRTGRRECYECEQVAEKELTEQAEAQHAFA